MLTLAKPTAAAALLLAIALASASAGWVLQGWRLHAQIDAIEAQHAKKEADAATLALAAERTNQTKLKKAQDEANAKETTLRSDAANARTQLDGLRGQLTTLRADFAAATRASITERAIASGELLTECAARYSEVAEKADRHALDAAKLYQSWPVNPPAAGAP